MEVNCNSLQVNLGLIGARLGTCTGADGRSYLDLGGAVGPGLGVAVIQGRETRSGLIQGEARAAAGVGDMVEASTSSPTPSRGIGASATVGGRGLLPVPHFISGIFTRSSR
jgi:hypothetical protein